MLRPLRDAVHERRGSCHGFSATDVARAAASLEQHFQVYESVATYKQFGRCDCAKLGVIGGRQVNGIATLLTGFPFTPQIGANRSGDGNTRNPDRPSLNPSFTGPVVLGTQAQWFNPNAFRLPTAGTFGNLGRGVYTGPGLADVDLSVFKNTALAERLNLQFRSEFFNLLNRTNLGTPNATVLSGASINPSAGLISGHYAHTDSVWVEADFLVTQID